MKIVVKFGGSSLASAEQFKKVGKIIKKDEARKYVIPSAPGKRTPDDTKVTDLLYRVPTLRDPLSPKPCMPTCTRTGRMCPGS